MIKREFLGNNAGLIISLGLVVIILPLALATHSGTIEDYINYFIIASFIVPIAPILVNKNWKAGLMQAVIMIMLIILLTRGYWEYRDKSYLPQRFDCDGPCYGGFGFENEINNYALIQAGIAGLITGGIIRIIKTKLAK